jgi:glycosyltransferase involved in cell wall biosynthesis
MKTLVIASDCFLPRWDGIARFLIEMIPRLKKSFRIRIIAPGFKGKSPDLEGVEIIRMPLVNIQFGDIYLSYATKRKVERYIRDADMLFSQTIGPIGIASIKAAEKQNKPVIAFIHSIDWELVTQSIKRFKRVSDFIVRRLARSLYNKCDLLIIPHEEVYYKYKKNRITTKTEIVYMGTNTHKFEPPKSKADAKRNIGINSSHKVVGYHGRIGREKDLITLYRAFRRLEKKFEHIKLLIVGEGVKEHEYVFSSGRNIILPGSQDNVVPYLQAMDVYVLPSLTETSSLGTMEAMSCGLPVIVTPVGFLTQYIKEKENGMFFPVQNSMVLALKLENLLKNPALARSISVNARKTIVEKFSWDNTADKITKILERY